MLRWREDREAWQVTVEIGPDPSTGRRRRKTTLVRGSKREARRVELKLRQDLEGRAGLGDASGLMLRNYLAHWLEMMRFHVAPETWRSYEAKLRIHVVPALGATKLDRLHAFQIERLYEELAHRGRAPLTVHHVHAVLSAALRHAVRRDLIRRNPCDMLDVGKGERRVMRALTAAEARQLLAACDRADLVHADAIAVTLLCGFRLGETLGLRWSACDLDRGILMVKATRQRQPGKGLVDRQPKTSASRRAVPCGSYGVRVLQRVRARQTVISIGDGLVFEGVTDVTLRRVLRRMLEAEGLPLIRLHDLRHSWASLFSTWGGADLKMASAHLGHSGIAITADFYTHVPPAVQRHAVQEFQRWLLAESGAQMAHSD